MIGSHQNLIGSTDFAAGDQSGYKYFAMEIETLPNIGTSDKSINKEPMSRIMEKTAGFNKINGEISDNFFSLIFDTSQRK
jgi:hypothetical protein